MELARRFAREGWRVFAGSYLPDWPELGALASEYSDRITVVALDIGSDASVKSASDLVGNQVGQVDMVINNAAISSPLKEKKIHEKQDFDELLRLYNVNTLGALRVVQAFLPLTTGSAQKRLCFVSSEAGSINRCEREAWYGYCMSKAALNMGVKRLFQTLHPQGYTFRLFHPGWMRTYMSGTKNLNAELEPDEVAASAFSYFTIPRSEQGEEDRLVMRDWRGREWPW